MKYPLLLLLSLCLLPFTAAAKVSPEEAEQLGTTLTPMGARLEGNDAGTIPPYTGTILGTPEWVEYKGTGTHYPDPYPDEKPLFTITAANYKQHLDNLTDGQIALFEMYPESFRMPIYPSKRDTRYSDFVHENIKMNAVSAEIVSEGNGTGNAFFGTPFPFAKTGLELIWNHQAAPQFEASQGILDGAAVFSDGSISTRTTLEERYILFFSERLGREAFNNQEYGGMIMVQILGPVRKKGEVILVHEYRDVSLASRNAWQYLPGTRRVRRAPTIAYDFPDGPGGLRTVDDALLFNGATDRYTWKMEAMRELYVPYNNNRLDDPSVSYETLLTPSHINPDYMRYELHRCWVVVGELRDGKRHIYHKRRLYLEEDSWAGLLADNYDGQGRLWRTNMRTFVNQYDLPGMGPRIEMYHDLQKKAYLANYLINEQDGPPHIVSELWDDTYFTVTNVRKLGKR